MADYAELQISSNYSFLIGAAHPDELVTRAAALGQRALAITDHNSLAGIVRAHVAAGKVGVRLVVGARLNFRDHPSLLCYPRDRAAYGRLCRLITLGRRRAPKGECHLDLADLWPHAEGQELVLLPDSAPPEGDLLAQARLLADRLPGQVAVAATCRQDGQDRHRLARSADLAAAVRLPLLATNDVRYHVPQRRAIQDVLTCLRHGCTLAEAGFRLAPHAERYLKPPTEMARLFRDHPAALTASVALADRCRFSLGELSFDYPDEAPGDGRSAQQRLTDLAWSGAAGRYPTGIPAKVSRQIDHELALIGQLGYAPYFLTVHDLVDFARSRGILCQGRGSAANSAVCYCLGVTSVDPARMDLLFERFISAARNEPPDIDVDFEHERREEVIQHLYARYGRDHAGLTAVASCFRARGAVREIGKVLGLSQDLIGRLAEGVWGWSAEAVQEERVREIGLDPQARPVRLLLELARELIGFPRHLSQHVGGFVITRHRLDEVVPVANAAMADRTTIEWNKDDLDALRILKVDVLALGMLSCVRRGFDLLRRHHGVDYDLASLPAEDPAVYTMLSRADSLGVFQVESRAQMTMLPRLKPRNFYDLVIEVAIVRPGPIQGDMVHPYLRRRNGLEPVEFPSEELRQVLGKTLGVPLFQEQAMRIAMVAAGFTPDEADQLRRAMATFRRAGVIEQFRDKMVQGMVARGYQRDFAERCFRQIEGFGDYGFPESHACSFALLVYVSAWLKCHYPAAFACALLNSQPMGFYAPAQIVRDARDHGVVVRPVDVTSSDWDCSLEPDPASAGGMALRLGLRQFKGGKEGAMQALLAARADHPFHDAADLRQRAGLTDAQAAALAAADALRGLGLDRRAAEWQLRAPDPTLLPLFSDAPPLAEPRVDLPVMALGQQVVLDYARTGLSLKRHPLALLRPALQADRPTPAEQLAHLRSGRRLTVAGLVLVRQRPGTAKGVVFITLEDDTGIANLIITRPVQERFRRTVLTARLLVARGRLENRDSVVHLLVDHLADRSFLLAGLAGGGEEMAGRSRDFR